MLSFLQGEPGGSVAAAGPLWMCDCEWSGCEARDQHRICGRTDVGIDAGGCRGCLRSGLAARGNGKACGEALKVMGMPSVLLLLSCLRRLPWSGAAHVEPRYSSTVLRISRQRHLSAMPKCYRSGTNALPVRPGGPPAPSARRPDLPDEGFRRLEWHYTSPAARPCRATLVRRFTYMVR